MLQNIFFKVADILVLIVLSMSLFTDLKDNKIKNIVVYPFMLIGFILNIINNGITGGLSSIYGILIPILLLMILFIMGALGAGDIKLFSAIGAIKGDSFIIKTMVASFLCGGILAIIFMLFRKNGRERLVYLITYIGLIFLTGDIIPYTNKSNNKANKFPFALAIFSGGIITLFLG